MNTPRFHISRRRTLGALAASLACTALPALAQSDFPSKPIRFVVPFAAGGALDYVARTLGSEITRQTKAQVIVDNKPGASGIIAAENVKTAPADGYTVLITNMDSHVNNVGLFKTLPYDPIRDFQPLGMLAAAAAILVSPGNVPANTLGEFIAYARAEKNGVSFGTWGHGTYSHLASASLGRSAKIQVNAIPYKGETPVLQDLLGNNLNSAMASVLVAKAQTEKGSLKAYAVNGEKRLALMPNVPTFKELGYNDPVLNLRPWFAAYAPAGTPKPVAERLNSLLRNALNEPGVFKALSEKGFEPIGSGTAEHQKELAVQIQAFTQVMRDVGIKPE